MKIGRIARATQCIVPDSERRVTLYNFAIETPSASMLRLPHASAATPARYLLEMLRRLTELPGNDGVAILNPLVHETPAELGLVIQALVPFEGEGRLAVLSDAVGQPVAYHIPRRIARTYGTYLTLLSTTDASVDAKLMRLLTNESVDVTSIPARYRFCRGRGEFYSDHAQARLYRWTALRAIAELERTPAHAPGETPFAVIMPFHAGDVLFLGLALRRGRSHFGAVVVDRRYRGILAEVVPEIQLIEIDLAPKARVEADLDWALVDTMETALPPGYYYVYGRPSRLYDAYPVHLIDQYRFGVASASAVHSGVPDLARGGGRMPFSKKVLFHFDAGWSMKVYSRAQQQELIALAASAGFEVTVLSRQDEATRGGVRFVRFGGLLPLRQLILEHAMLIGMDSFPAHYAAHILSVPTICLFSSTHPANSDAPESSRYRAMHKRLDCCPCGSVSRCPKFGGDRCRNFSDPAAVVEAMRAMWGECYVEDK